MDTTRAAWAVVCACFLFSLPRAPSPLPPCPHPGIVGQGLVRVATCETPSAAPVTGPIRRLFGLPIDVNHASLETLVSLPGIGPGRAQAIIEGRPYAAVEELRRVPGLGPRLLAGLAGLITAESRGGEEPIASHGTTWR